MATAMQTTKNDFTVQTYGEDSEIKSLSQRIKLMVPGGRSLKDEEAQALAQLTIVTGLNPFIGEIWYIPGKGPMVGIKGAMRTGSQQVEEAGGKDAYWTPDLQPCSPEEAGAKDIKDVFAAYKCVITDSVSTKKYQTLFLETVNTLRAAGDTDPVGSAREICGKRPQWIGYGYSTVGESSRMNKQALARKRASADALKQRFYIPFGADVAAGDNAQEAAPEWIDGTATTSHQTDEQQGEYTTETHEMTIEEARYTNITTVSGVDKPMGTLPIETLNKAYLSDKTTDEQKRAAAMILKVDHQMEPPAQ